MKSFIYLILGFILIAGSLYLFLQKPVPETVFERTNTSMERSVVEIGDALLEVEMARTNAEQKQGLSGRISLEEDTGMLFIFEQVGKKGFWMKDMLFPIDIIWIDADGRVLGIERDVSPGSYPQVFFSPTQTSYVLEVNAGVSHRLGLQVDSQLNFKHK